MTRCNSIGILALSCIIGGRIMRRWTRMSRAFQNLRLGDRAQSQIRKGCGLQVSALLHRLLYRCMIQTAVVQTSGFRLRLLYRCRVQTAVVQTSDFRLKLVYRCLVQTVVTSTSPSVPSSRYRLSLPPSLHRCLALGTNCCYLHLFTGFEYLMALQTALHQFALLQ